MPSRGDGFTVENIRDHALTSPGGLVPAWRSSIPWNLGLFGSGQCVRRAADVERDCPSGTHGQCSGPFGRPSMTGARRPPDQKAADYLPGRAVNRCAHPFRATSRLMRTLRPATSADDGQLFAQGSLALRVSSGQRVGEIGQHALLLRLRQEGQHTFAACAQVSVAEISDRFGGVPDRFGRLGERDSRYLATTAIVQEQHRRFSASVACLVEIRLRDARNAEVLCEIKREPEQTGRHPVGPAVGQPQEPLVREFLQNAVNRAAWEGLLGCQFAHPPLALGREGCEDTHRPRGGRGSRFFVRARVRGRNVGHESKRYQEWRDLTTRTAHNACLLAYVITGTSARNYQVADIVAWIRRVAAPSRGAW
jgi:hypothetical protein